MKVSTKRSKFEKITDKIAYMMELIVSAIIIIAAGALIVRMIYELMFSRDMIEMTGDRFSILLGDLLSITVGIEFIKLLTKQRITELIEVVLLALTRQLVVEHLGMTYMFMGVLAIAVLFLIRKYLFTAEETKAHEKN